MAFKSEETKPTVCRLTSEALRIHFNDFMLAIQDPEVVACALYSVNIISSGVMDEVRSIALSPVNKKMALLAAVRDKLTLEPEKFGDLMIVLENNSPTLRIFAQRLKDTHAKLLSQPISVRALPGKLECY